MRYFPDPVSAWVFLSLLAALLAVASYTDQRWMKVPKWLTIPGFIAGLVVSLLRGAYLGSQGLPVWLFDAGPVVGAFDALLFALAGVVVGFGLFFLLWAVGVCGGGDVKLFAALGAWVGPWLVAAVFAASLLLLWVYVFVVFAARILRGVRAAKAAKAEAKPVFGRIVIRYSLIATMAALPVLVWCLRADLGILPRHIAVPVPTEVARADG